MNYKYITSKNTIFLKPIIVAKEVTMDSEGNTKTYIRYKRFAVWGPKFDIWSWGPEEVLGENEFNKKFFIEYL